MGHHVAFEQSSVARQDDPTLHSRSRGQMCIITIALVRGVETEETQVASQPAEMRIRKEPWLAQRFGPYHRDRTDVEGLEYRVDRDSITVAYPVREIHGFAV